MQQSQDPCHTVVPSYIVDISREYKVGRLEIWAGTRQASNDDDHGSGHRPTHQHLPNQHEGGIPEDSSSIDSWQYPQSEYIDETSSEHVSEVDKENMPSFDGVIFVDETDCSGDETASERPGSGYQGDPA